MSNVPPIQLGLNLVLFFMWFVFLNVMLERRFGGWAAWAAWLAAFFVWVFGSTLCPYGSAARLSIGPVLLFGAIFLMFKSHWTRCLFAGGAAYATMYLSELIMFWLFPELTQLTVGVAELPDMELLGMTLVYLPINAALLCTAALLFRRYRSGLPDRDWLLYALFPVSQGLISGSWLKAMITGGSVEAVYFQAVALLVCLAADVALYHSMRGMEQRARLQAERDLLEKQVDAQKEHYAALSDQYEGVRRMRHDIENHLHTIHILLENGQNAEAAAYASELQAGRWRSSLGQCQNPVADAFLYHRLEELRAQGIAVEADVALPAHLGISNAELISAFGNLLDNAAEACRAAGEKRIALKAHLREGWLLVGTENPMPQAPSGEKKRRIPELERGVGFHILKELAEKYEGTFAVREENGVFSSSLLLREVTGDAANCHL